MVTVYVSLNAGLFELEELFLGDSLEAAGHSVGRDYALHGHCLGLLGHRAL